MAIYFVAGKLGLVLAFINASASPVWPPTGIAIASVLIFGPRVWIGIFVGAFLVNQTTAGSLMTSMAIAGGNTLEALVAAYAVNRFAGGRAAFENGRNTVLFVVLAGLFSTMIGASVGVTSLSLAGFATWSAYGPVWLTWWLGDATGAVLITPLILLWAANPRVSWSRGQATELLALLLLVLLVGWLAFSATPYPLAFLGIALSVWAGFRFGQREAATVSCLLSAIAIWGTLHGGGSLAFISLNQALLILQGFMATTAVVGITVGAAVAEHRHSEAWAVQLNEELDARVRTRTGDLRVSEERLEEAQEVAHIGNWEWKITENNLWWSNELYRIFELAPGSFRPSFEAFFQRIHPDDHDMVADRIKRAADDHQSFHFEFRIIRTHGEVRTLHSQGRVELDDHGRVHRMYGIAQDITQRKRLEEQFWHSQKIEAIGRLAGGVAHDFNNILTVIDGYADMLLQQIGDDKPISGDLREIHLAAERGAALTRQLLAFTRKQVVRMVGVDLNTVISSVIHMLRHNLGEDLQIVTPLAHDLRPVLADSTQLQQVLMNLAINGRDAMPNGGTLTIETTNVDLATDDVVGLSEGRYVRVTVADTGHGMDASVKAHLFEPFFTTKEQEQGTGLGLATVYGIVQQFHGAITVESERGRGTTFTLYFPETQARVTAPPTPPARSGNIVGGETIFVVEDDHNVRVFVSRVLKRHGYRVYAAATPAQALQSKDRAVHLLLTDIVMPAMNGWDLSMAFRETHPEIQVLYMSGLAGHAILSRGLSTGDLPFLEKPFTSTSLLRKVRETLDARLAEA